jgi:lysozyme family protein
MKANAATCIALTFHQEQGYVNHPKDPGGPTNFGVTMATLAAARGHKVNARDVQGLSREEAAGILKKLYWDTCNADALPKGLDYAVFDFGVNSGPARAVKELQKLLPGVAPDGILGLKTLDAIFSYRTGLDSLVVKLCNARLDFCRSLKTWSTFGRGWTRRITGKDPLRKYKDQLGVVGEALAMMEHKTPLGIMAAPEIPTAKARDEDRGVFATPRTTASITAVATAVAAVCAAIGAAVTPYAATMEAAQYVLMIATVIGGGAGALLTVKDMRGQGTHA